jgi:hypothetical protein
MYILLADETNLQPGRNSRFFIYGGLFMSIENLSSLHILVDQIRQKAGYEPDDELKFSTRARPKHVTEDACKDAKQAVIQACCDLDCHFTACVIHHGILKNRETQEQICMAADTVIGRFHYFLRLTEEDGICVIDNMSRTHQWAYLSDKLAHGLHLHNGRIVPLPRIKLYATTCVGASHANSATDIVLGAFRYAVNHPQREVSRKLLKEVTSLMWYENKDGFKVFRDRGLVMRPSDVRVKEYRDDYNELTEALNELLGNVVPAHA